MRSIVMMVIVIRIIREMMVTTTVANMITIKNEIIRITEISN